MSDFSENLAVNRRHRLAYLCLINCQTLRALCDVNKCQLNELHVRKRSAASSLMMQQEASRRRAEAQMLSLLQTGYLVAVPMPHVAATELSTTKTNENYFKPMSARRRLRSQLAARFLWQAGVTMSGCLFTKLDAFELMCVHKLCRI